MVQKGGLPAESWDCACHEQMVKKCNVPDLTSPKFTACYRSATQNRKTPENVTIACDFPGLCSASIRTFVHHGRQRLAALTATRLCRQSRRGKHQTVQQWPKSVTAVCSALLFVCTARRPVACTRRPAASPRVHRRTCSLMMQSLVRAQPSIQTSGSW